MHHNVQIGFVPGLKWLHAMRHVHFATHSLHAKQGKAIGICIHGDSIKDFMGFSLG